jgi:hypothetical protein
MTSAYSPGGKSDIGNLTSGGAANPQAGGVRVAAFIRPYKIITASAALFFLTE